MARKANDPYVDGPIKLKIPPKICEKCGGKYIPTGNRQKYCQACAEGRKGFAGSGSGPVRTFLIEPKKKEKEMAEQKKDPALVKAMDEWQESFKKMEEGSKDLPDRLQMVDEIEDILRRYYKGELVEKPEPQRPVNIAGRLGAIAFRICTEVCKFEYESDGTKEYCGRCAVMEL